jgi:hypothetical protein
MKVTGTTFIVIDPMVRQNNTPRKVHIEAQQRPFGNPTGKWLAK